MKANFFKIDFCYYMRRDDDTFTRVWHGNREEFTAIEIVPRQRIDFTKPNILQSSLEEFQEHLNAAINILAITSHVLTLSEASNHSFQQAVEMTEHPELTGMILNAYDKVLNDMKSEREDNELDVQGITSKK